MIRIFKHVFIITILLFCLFSMFSVAYGQEISKGIVIDKTAVLMKEPKMDSMVVSNLSLGENVFIEENKGKWFKVSTSNALWGWVHSEFVLSEDKEKNLILDGIVNTGTLSVREKPGDKSSIVGEIGFLTKVSVVEKNAEWYHLSLGNEMIGWVPSEFIITTPHYIQAEVMVENANVMKEGSNDSEIKENLKKDSMIKICDFKDEWFFIKWGESQEGWIHNSEIKIVHKDFFEKKKKITKEEEKEEFDEIISRSTYLGEGYNATAYDLSIASCGKAIGAKYRGLTRTGIDLNGKSWKEAMVVAVDPREISLGSNLLILFDEKDWRSAYNGVYLAGDTGGGVKGKIVDLYLGDIGNKQIQEVKDFGRTYNVKIYLLN